MIHPEGFKYIWYDGVDIFVEYFVLFVVPDWFIWIYNKKEYVVGLFFDCGSISRDL